MSVKYFSKLFQFHYKYQTRLLKFPNCVLDTRLSISSHSEPVSKVETQLKEFSNEKSRIRSFNATNRLGEDQLGVHLYLSKNSDKYDVVKYEDMDLTGETNFKSLVLLKNLVEKSSPEEPEMNIIPEELTNCIESECSSYSLNDIFKFIILISKVRNVDSRKTLIRYLNNELIKRKSKLTKKEHLKILHLSAVLLRENYFKVYFSYTRRKIMNLTEKINSLTQEQMVVYFSIIRRLPEEVVKNYKFNVTMSLLKNLPNFNIDEMIIVSRGFFMGNMQIERPFAVAFVKKFMEEVGNPCELPIFWIFKIIGSGAHLLRYYMIAAFQEKILPHAGKYKGNDLIHLARTGEKIAYINLSLWEILANNFKKNIKNYSLVDIEKMVCMTVLCNIQDEELLKMSIEEFQNADISSSSSCNALISFVYDLIHHQIYIEKLLSLVLSKDFILKYNIGSTSFLTNRKYCFINSFIKFHRPESNFEFLENKKQLKLYRLFKVYPVDFGIYSCFKALYFILLSLQNIFGKNFVCFTSFQPHFSKGIVMRFDKNLEAQPIPEEFMLSKENYKRALKDDHIWLFIIVVNCYHYKQDTDIPNFEIQTQLRELEAFGYAPVLIPNHMMLRKKSQASEDYLKDVLKNKVQELKNNQRATI